MDYNTVLILWNEVDVGNEADGGNEADDGI